MRYKIMKDALKETIKDIDFIKDNNFEVLDWGTVINPPAYNYVGIGWLQDKDNSSGERKVAFDIQVGIYTLGENRIENVDVVQSDLTYLFQHEFATNPKMILENEDTGDSVDLRGNHIVQDIIPTFDVNRLDGFAIKIIFDIDFEDLEDEEEYCIKAKQRLKELIIDGKSQRISKS